LLLWSLFIRSIISVEIFNTEHVRIQFYLFGIRLCKMAWSVQGFLFVCLSSNCFICFKKSHFLCGKFVTLVTFLCLSVLPYSCVSARHFWNKKSFMNLLYSWSFNWYIFFRVCLLCLWFIIVMCLVRFGAIQVCLFLLIYPVFFYHLFFFFFFFKKTSKNRKNKYFKLKQKSAQLLIVHIYFIIKFNSATIN